MDFSSLFTIQEKCFKFAGQQRLEGLRFQKLLKACQGLVIVNLLFMMASEVRYIALHSGDIVASADAASPFCTQIISISKILSLIVSRSKFDNIMNEIKLLAKDTKNGKEIDRVKKWNRNLSYVYLLSVVVSCGGYIFGPIILNFVNFSSGEPINYEMPFRASFQYDITLWPAYIWTYTLYSFTIYVASLVSVSLLISISLSLNNLI